MLDVQSSSVIPRFPLAAVGVTNLRYPLLFVDAGVAQATVADWTLSVTLPADQRGTHMSRFVEQLSRRSAQPLGLDGCLAFATELLPVLGAERVMLQATFPWFRAVAAPVTGKEALLEHRLGLKVVAGSASAKTLIVGVTAKALCPCSKAISDRGAHNQRAELEAILTLAAAAPCPAAADVARRLEASASSPVYPVLKREDEKYVTERAYDHPGFVEDIVREAASQVAQIPGLTSFEVSVVNRESIHAHDCFARIVHPG